MTGGHFESFDKAVEYIAANLRKDYPTVEELAQLCATLVIKLGSYYSLDPLTGSCEIRGFANEVIEGNGEWME